METSLRYLFRCSGACCDTLMFPELTVWSKPKNLDRSEFHIQGLPQFSKFKQPLRVPMQYAQLPNEAPTFRYWFHGCRKLKRPCAGSHPVKPACAF